jgi:hemoglobin-like flavoprotein
MEKKQTAVEWFYQRILAKDIKEVFEQAKQIEKEQMKEAYLIADHYPRVYEFEKYYKETYQTK